MDEHPALLALIAGSPTNFQLLDNPESLAGVAEAVRKLDVTVLDRNSLSATPMAEVKWNPPALHGSIPIVPNGSGLAILRMETIQAGVVRPFLRQLHGETGWKPELQGLSGTPTRRLTSPNNRKQQCAIYAEVPVRRQGLTDTLGAS